MITMTRYGFQTVKWSIIIEDEVGDIKRHVATRYERVLIRRGKKHKIINPSAVELCIFEMQLGRIESGDKKLYLSEDSSYGK